MTTKGWNWDVRTKGRWPAFLILLVGLLLWLWPIGIGGKMPVGGDVTQFFLGLMEVLTAALREMRLPIWNDLWGYGFPGIGESQMGVYYPPHLVLYGLLRTEYAYVASLILHTCWGALGAWWAARRFGVSPIGSSLAAFVYAASGFFVIHMPHPWGYTTGSWLPWAWGLAWLLLNGPEIQPRLAGKLFCLSAVLALQILPGHFQLAFFTQVSIVLMAAWCVLESWIRSRSADPATKGAVQQTLRPVVGIAACLISIFPLAALQLWPTARLARLAASQRDFDYLSGFAATPLHLVNYVAPGLFHDSPLWRPILWDPFHTSPEEQFCYVGLVPLFLAILVLIGDLRRDRSVRVLAILAGVSLGLSLGPYVPGFRLLIELPGFSFFRAPARWSLPTALALAILAGKGLDRCLEWPRPERLLAWLAGVSAVWIVLVLGLIELAIVSGSSGGNAWLAGVFDKAFQARPWTDDPDFRAVLAEARKPVGDSRNSTTFIKSRRAIYTRELGGTAAMLVGILALAGSTLLFSRRDHLPAGMLVLTFLDLMIAGRYRPVAFGPLRALEEQSPVLARLAREPRGTRISGRYSNLPMLVDLGPVVAYRTLDLPALTPLGQLAQERLGPEGLSSAARRAMRSAGVGVRVLDPLETAHERRLARSKGGREVLETIDDAALPGWMFGADWIARQGTRPLRFGILHPEAEPHRAWFLPLTAIAHPDMLEAWDGDLEPLLALFDQALPLRAEWHSTQVMDVFVDAKAPGWIIVSQLADPQWRAQWRDRDTEGRLATEILPTFRQGPGDGGWQRVRVPSPGRWTLHLEYVAADVREGLAISAVSWFVWCLILGQVAVRERRKEQA